MAGTVAWTAGPRDALSGVAGTGEIRPAARMEFDKVTFTGGGTGVVISAAVDSLARCRHLEFAATKASSLTALAAGARTCLISSLTKRS